DNTCATSAGSFTMAAAQTQVFWFKDTLAGAPVTLSVNNDRNSTANQVKQTETINVGWHTQTVFLTASQVRGAGACSNAVTVQAQDSFGDAVAASSTLTPSLGGTTLYTNNTCATSAASFTMAAAQTQVFWFKDTLAGAPVTLSVNNSTALTPNPVKQTETINAGGPTQLVFLSASQVLGAGACSNAVTVQAQDSFGNPVAASSTLTPS